MHKLIRKQVLISLLAASFIYPSALNASNKADNNENKAAIITQADLKWKTLPNMSEGAQIAMIHGDSSKAERYVFQLKIPDGYLIPSHWHSNDEETTIISGTLNFGIGDKVNKSEAKTLTAGDYAFVSGQTRHYLWSTGETIIQDAGMGPRDTIFVNPEELKRLFKKNK